MSKDDKWRREADRLLSSPVPRERGLATVVGRVEDRFDGILAARRRGVSWKAIARALEHGGDVTVAAAESAFKRICHERNVAPPSRRTRGKTVVGEASPAKAISSTSEQPSLFAKRERYVDDGY